MNETPHIEHVSLITPKPPAPDMTPKRTVLTQSVVNAVKLHHERMAEAELNAIQRLYEQGKLSAEEIALLVEAGKITQSKNIFQIIQEQGMNALFAFILTFVKNNWRTTVAGLAVVGTQALAKLGVTLSQHEVDALMGIGYAIIFKFSVVRWDLPTIVGIVLMVLSFFVNPIVGGLGIAVNPMMLSFITMSLQQAVATLLKDQQAIFTQPVPQQ